MKTSRRAQARVFLHLFYFILLAATYFFSFLNATSLFGERNRLGSKLDNFFIPSPPDNFLAALLCYEVDLFNNFITEHYCTFIRLSLFAIAALFDFFLCKRGKGAFSYCLFMFIMICVQQSDGCISL